MTRVCFYAKFFLQLEFNCKKKNKYRIPNNLINDNNHKDPYFEIELENHQVFLFLLNLLFLK